MSDTERETQAAPDTEPDAPQTDEPDTEQGDETIPPPNTGPLEIPTPLRETDEDAVTGPTTIPDEGHGEQEQRQESEPSQDSPSGLSEKELEARFTKIHNENDRHRKRVAEILAEDALALVPCPVCSEAFHGWIFDPAYAPLTDEMRERMLQLLGLDSYETMPEAPWAVQCQTCQGYGKVKTGSRVPERETTTCLDCNGAGWNNRKQEAASNGLTPAEIPATTGPTVYGAAEPDARVLTLREEGWTVFPPVQIAGVD